jgi:hypothetical protein
MGTICPYCNIEVDEAAIEIEDGCCPECGSVITMSSGHDGEGEPAVFEEEEEDFFDEIDYEDEDEDYGDYDEYDDFGDDEDEEDYY